MRLSPRNLFISGIIAAAAFTQAACSSSGTNATPPSVPLQSQSVKAESNTVAFPTTLAAFPITLSARPICQTQTDSTSVLCQANQYDSAAVPNPSAAPSQIPGIRPAQLAQQYNYNPASGGSNQTVAVVVAFDDSTYLENDLNVYRSTFGMSPCTVASGCLTFVNQYPKLAIPDVFGLWPIEADVDVEMVSAVCPNCKILVAQALDRHIKSMSATNDVAVANGATEVSNSWSIPESSGALGYAAHFAHPGIPITAGAGDGGFGVGFPADVASVIAVGGTTLNIATHQESVWPLTGSGCSALVAKPAFQTDAGCPNRTANDVAVVADPTTGVAVYSTTAGGWVVMGGTSLGPPIIAAMYALQGNAGQIDDATSLYKNAGSFNKILTGSNGTCSPSYLCTAGGVYSGPTGVGSPNGTAGF